MSGRSIGSRKIGGRPIGGEGIAKRKPNKGGRGVGAGGAPSTAGSPIGLLLALTKAA
jgi:hypothetical protein